MGYTHYYSRGRNTSAKGWSVFTKEVQEILEHPALVDLLCFEYDDPDAPPIVNDDEVRFNGKGEHGHETFRITKDAHKDFCKTGGVAQMGYADSWGKSYDVAVCSVLLSASHHLKEKVSSDGDWHDENWMRARVLHAKITSRMVPCPWPQKQCSQCSRFFARDGHNWGGSKACSKCGGGSYSNSALGTMCMGCKAMNTIRKAKPLSWCWYCSNGYEGKDDAARAIEKMWAELTESLKKLRTR